MVEAGRKKSWSKMSRRTFRVSHVLVSQSFSEKKKKRGKGQNRISEATCTVPTSGLWQSVCWASSFGPGRLSECRRRGRTETTVCLARILKYIAHDKIQGSYVGVRDLGPWQNNYRSGPLPEGGPYHTCGCKPSHPSFWPLPVALTKKTVFL